MFKTISYTISNAEKSFKTCKNAIFKDILTNILDQSVTSLVLNALNFCSYVNFLVL